MYNQNQIAYNNFVAERLQIYLLRRKLWHLNVLVVQVKNQVKAVIHALTVVQIFT